MSNLLLIMSSSMLSFSLVLFHSLDHYYIMSREVDIECGGPKNSAKRFRSESYSMMVLCQLV